MAIAKSVSRVGQVWNFLIANADEAKIGEDDRRWFGGRPATGSEDWRHPFLTTSNTCEDWNVIVPVRQMNIQQDKCTLERGEG